MAQSVVRSTIGTIELQGLFENRSTINNAVLDFMKNNVEAWGAEVLRYEVTEMTPSDRRVKDSLHKKAVAEREKKETILRSEANREKQARESDAQF